MYKAVSPEMGSVLGGADCCVSGAQVRPNLKNIIIRIENSTKFDALKKFRFQKTLKVHFFMKTQFFELKNKQTLNPWAIRPAKK